MLILQWQYNVRNIHPNLKVVNERWEWLRQGHFMLVQISNMSVSYYRDCGYIYKSLSFKFYSLTVLITFNQAIKL